jgi:hypothetical protein
MGTFLRNADLPAENLTRQDLYDLVENIKPQADLADGESVEVVDLKLQATRLVPRWRKFTITHADLTLAANSQVIAILESSNYAMVHAAFCKHSTAFSGGGASAVTVSIGTRDYLDRYLTAFDVAQAVAQAAHQFNTVVYPAGSMVTPALEVVAYFTVTDAVASALTAGSVDIHVLYNELI